MEQDLGIIAGLFDHPSDPFQSVQPVHGAKSDVGAFAVAVGSLINEEHPEAVIQIVIRKTSIVVQPLAGVPVETDDSLCPPVPRKICTVQLQPVLGPDPHVLVGLRHHPVAALMHEGKMALPVHAGHLYGALHLCVVSLHGPSVEVSCPAGFRRGRGPQEQGRPFQ